MRARPTRAGTDRPAAGRLVAPVQERPEFSLEGDIGRIEHLSAGDDDDVEPTLRLVVTEQLAGKPPGAIPDYCRSELAGRRNPQTGVARSVRSDEEGHQAAGQPPAAVVDPLEIRAGANVLRRPEAGHDPSPAR